MSYYQHIFTIFHYQLAGKTLPNFLTLWPSVPNRVNSSSTPTLINNIQPTTQHMQLFIQPPNGPPLTILVDMTCYLASVKAQVQTMTGIPPSAQIVLLQSKTLSDSVPLCNQGVNSLSTLHIALSILGGTKKGDKVKAKPKVVLSKDTTSKVQKKRTANKKISKPTEPTTTTASTSSSSASLVTAAPAST